MRPYDYSHRRSGGCMTEHDFGELYTYLELFLNTYIVHENDVKVVLQAILETYVREYSSEDPVHALKVLRNPRNAGRKQQTTDEDICRIENLRSEGCSIRSISEKTGIPKSTVQRVLKSPLTRN